ncbi:MAG: hypothetical protein QOD86_1825, partial [Miltoncostaeaceae bacterium]|nr:hypothetical protein [Miltoncostaeaceae bacterium]
GAPAGPSARPAVPGAPAPSGVPARLVPSLPSGEPGVRQGGGAAPGPAAPGRDGQVPPSAPAGLSGVAGGQGTALLFGIAALCGLVGLARPPDGLRRLPPAPATPVPVALIPSLERPG